MNGKILIVVIFAAAAAGIFFWTREHPPAQVAQAPSGDSKAAAVEISMLYSTEKKEWIEAAAATFRRDHPEIALKLIWMGSLDAAQAILDERQKPILWSPADSLALNLLAADWTTKHGAAAWASDGPDAPVPLVITPLVFAVWSDRAEALEKAGGGTISWKAVHKAVSSPQGWPSVGGKPDWGFVKLGHTDPTRSNSGLQALVLMTFDFLGRSSGLEIADVLKPEYQQFVKEVEKGVTRFEASTGTFMNEMVLFGPSKYDVAVVYENLAISQLENAQGRWGDLKVYYPAITLWSDHPVTLLQAPWVTDPQKQAARKLVEHLRSRPVQEQALAHGFRPADPAVPLKSGDARNPFTRLAQYGVRVDIPPVAQPPSGGVVRALMTMWSRTVGSK
jgi:ABC-type glycerol-3-phosphate transport system substrate-binding protein